MFARMMNLIAAPAAAPLDAALTRASRVNDDAAARLHLLRLNEAEQCALLQRLPHRDAVRLASGLAPYTVARLYERLPARLADAIVRGLPAVKRHAVRVILNHRALMRH